MSFKWGKQGAVHAHLLHFYIVGLPCSSFTQVKTLLSTHEQYMQLAGWVFGPLPYKHCMTESWCFDPVTGKLREMLDADYPPNCRRASLPPAYENCYPIDENGMHRELRVQASTPLLPFLSPSFHIPPSFHSPPSPHQTQPYFFAKKWCGQMLRAMQELKKAVPACPAFGLYLSNPQFRHYENEAGGGVAFNARVRISSLYLSRPISQCIVLYICVYVSFTLFIPPLFVLGYLYFCIVLK